MVKRKAKSQTVNSQLNDLLAFRCRATYCWKDLNKAYILFLNLTLIKGLHKKLLASKVARVPISGFSRLST